MELRMSADSAPRNETADTPHLTELHPGFARFYEELKRNHPEMTDQEIGSLFEAWVAR
jgi:hypothetical protein